MEFEKGSEVENVNAGMKTKKGQFPKYFKEKQRKVGVQNVSIATRHFKRDVRSVPNDYNNLKYQPRSSNYNDYMMTENKKQNNRVGWCFMVAFETSSLVTINTTETTMKATEEMDRGVVTSVSK